MKILRTLGYTAAGLVATALIASAGNIPLLTSSATNSEPSQIIPTVNSLISYLNTNQNAIFYGNTTPRNYIDNGAMQITQRGGTATCANNGSAIASANYGPDRWACQVNVGSGAGQLTTTTSTPVPPLGFTNAATLVRNSGALLQPQCVYQAIPSSNADDLALGPITLSFYGQALAGAATDTGALTVTAYVITGTGTDQGFGSWTTSPAITPAWTNVAIGASQAFTLSTSAWQRYSIPNINLATTVKEIAVALCFTPIASGAGATDGIAFTGVQLENAQVAGPFEFLPIQMDLARAQRYAYVISEAAAGVVQVGGGSAQGTTTTCTTYIPFPVTMRTAPTYTNTLTASTFKVVSASQAATALGTPFSATLTANTVNGASVNFTTTGMTAKDGCFIVGAGGAGSMVFSADF